MRDHLGVRSCQHLRIAFRAAWTSFKESGSRTWTRFLRVAQVDVNVESKHELVTEKHNPPRCSSSRVGRILDRLWPGDLVWTGFLWDTVVRVNIYPEARAATRESLKQGYEVPPKVLVCRSHILGIRGPLCQSLSRKHIGEVHQRQAVGLNTNRQQSKKKPWCRKLQLDEAECDRLAPSYQHHLMYSWFRRDPPLQTRSVKVSPLERSEGTQSIPST